MPSKVENKRQDPLLPSDSAESFSHLISAFKRETSVILNFDNAVYTMYGTHRRESIKTYILKVLLFIGTPTTGNGLAVVARLLEVLFLHPELSPEEVIADFAKTHATTVDAVTYILEKCFKVYDNNFINRVVFLTNTNPLTAKDVLCDLSVFIRVKYLSKAEQ